MLDYYQMSSIPFIFKAFKPKLPIFIDLEISYIIYVFFCCSQSTKNEQSIYFIYRLYKNYTLTQYNDQFCILINKYNNIVKSSMGNLKIIAHNSRHFYYIKKPFFQPLLTYRALRRPKWWLVKVASLWSLWRKKSKWWWIWKSAPCV